MMSFGWRPMSIYGSATTSATSTQQQIEIAQGAVSTGQATPAQQSLVQAAAVGNVQVTACAPSPTWFYTLLAISIAAGLFRRRKR